MLLSHSRGFAHPKPNSHYWHSTFPLLASSIPLFQSMENKMAACLSLFAFALAMVMAIVLNACPANGDITCKDALLCVLPCEPFLSSSGRPTPSFSCCAGVAQVAAQATTPAIRKSLCECLKTAATGIQIDPPKLEQLPQFCKVSLPVTLDPHINCSQVPLF